MSTTNQPKVVLVNRCFILQNGFMLAMQRASVDTHHPSLWEAPGGKLEEGQDLHGALEREVMEETGFLVRPIDSMAHFQSYVIGGGGKYNGLPYVALFSIGEVIGGELTLSHEHDAARWLPYDAFMHLALTPETQKAGIVLRKRLCDNGVC